MQSTPAWFDRIQTHPESAQLLRPGLQACFVPTHMTLKLRMIQSHQLHPSSWRTMEDYPHIPAPVSSRAQRLNMRRGLRTSILLLTPRISNALCQCDLHSRTAGLPLMRNCRRRRNPTGTKMHPKEGPRDTPAATENRIVAKRPLQPRAMHHATPKFTLRKRQSTAHTKAATRNSLARTI
jgi:hypothetical protein